jgi:hypothetical protein
MTGITRAQYQVQVALAEQTKLASLLANEATRQAAIATGTSAAAASAAKITSDNLAEAVRQQTLMVQRDLLRQSGDLGPF